MWNCFSVKSMWFHIWPHVVAALWPFTYLFQWRSEPLLTVYRLCLGLNTMIAFWWRTDHWFKRNSIRHRLIKPKPNEGPLVARPIFKSVSRSTTSDDATAAAVAFPRPNPYIGYVSYLVSWHRVRLRYITKIGTAPIRRVSAWMDVRFVSQSRFVSSGVFHFRRAGVCVITAAEWRLGLQGGPKSGALLVFEFPYRIRCNIIVAILI